MAVALIARGVVEYRLWLSGSADGTASTGVAPEAAETAASAVRDVFSRTSIDAYLSMVGRSIAADLDATVDFVTVFTALEQYVKSAIPSKGGLKEKFTLLTKCYESIIDVAGDEDEFAELYAIRNDLPHEGRLPGDRTSADRVQALLGKYLLADLSSSQGTLTSPTVA